jgi:hypothetical protein
MQLLFESSEENPERRDWACCPVGCGVSPIVRG